MFEVKGKYTTARVMIDDVEPQCVSQITHFVNHPAFTEPVSIMPDTHAGKGSVIGFTMPMTDKVIPNVIGVDIGCALSMINIGERKFTQHQLELLDNRIRRSVPFGMEVHDKAVVEMKAFPWKRPNVLAQKFAVEYQNKFGVRVSPPHYSLEWFEEKCKTIGGDIGRFIKSLGTLGGGNHFIEMGTDLNGETWVTVHSGSRNFGKRICDYWQGVALKRFTTERRDEFRQKVIEIKTEYKHTPRKIKEEIAKLRTKLNLDDKIDMKGCEWLEGEDAAGYLFDMIFAQCYAEVNRQYMVRLIEDALETSAIDRIDTIHNFIDFRDFVVRKGAIRSYKDELMIIPFNMRDGLLICEGKSNEEWNCSAPHGAGRKMSRGQAKKRLSMDEFEAQMSGIYSNSVCRSTLDEAPDAYKDSSVIEQMIEPTARIVNRVVPIHNMKAR